MTVDLKAILRSNYVIRFAANPDLARHGDTDGHHQALVAQIIFACHPAPSMALVYGALHHDTGESGLGDMAGPAKNENPELAKVLEIAEARNREAMGVTILLNDEDSRWLRFADVLAAYAHVRHVARTVLLGDGWPECRHWLIKEAEVLGCVDHARAVMS